MAGIVLGFHITNRCQLNCDHCLRDPERDAVELEPELIARTVDSVQKHFPVQRVALTGGEPTLHAQFFDIVEALASRGVSWQIVTNAATLPRLAQRLAEHPPWMASFRGASISIDGADAEVHDGIRGEGSFAQVLQGAMLMKGLGKRLNFLVAVNRRNAAQVEAIGLLAARMGADSVSFSVTHPTGTLLDRTLMLTPAELRAVRDRLLGLRQALRIDVDLTDGWPLEHDFVVCQPWRFDILHVDIRGHLNLCCVHSGMPYDEAEGPLPPDVAGDLHTMPFDEAFPRLVAIVGDTMRRRHAALAAGTLDAWEKLPCNWCLKAMGRPYWSAAGPSGPLAKRERWQGAWTPGYKPSHIEAGYARPESDSGSAQALALEGRDETS
jgi:MoaA/NifB/PqqE/SkfB family radical SAM enzyme